MDALPFQFFPQITPWHGQTSLCIIVCQENAFLNASLDVLAGWKLYEVYPALWSSWPGNAIVTPLQRALWHLGNWIWYSWYMICTAALKTQVLLFRSRQRLLMGTGISHGSDWGFFFFLPQATGVTILWSGGVWWKKWPVWFLWTRFLQHYLKKRLTKMFVFFLCVFSTFLH